MKKVKEIGGGGDGGSGGKVSGAFVVISCIVTTGYKAV